MNTQFITAEDGIRIAYDVSGEGSALMLLHGAGRTRKDWHKTGYVDRLKETFTVICVDIRGSGDSDTPNRIEDYTIETITTELELIADACGADTYRVWGFSFGGNIARYLGAWSKRVKAIVVVGVPFGAAVPPDFDAYIDTFIKKYGPLAKQQKESGATTASKKSMIKGRIPVWIACFQAMRNWPEIHANQIPCPKILVAGTKNRSAYQWIKENQSELTDAGVNVAIFEGLTHSQEFSEINQVFPKVKDFLEKV